MCMKKIEQFSLLLIIGVFLCSFKVHATQRYEILNSQQIEYSDILCEGDGCLLLRNEKRGFSSDDVLIGVYNCIERKWVVEYQVYDRSYRASHYAREGIFALCDDETTTLINTKTQEFLYMDIGVNLSDLFFYNGRAVSGARASWGYGIFEIDEKGNYQNTGITDFVVEDGIMRPDYLQYVYGDERWAVYIYKGSDFFIYDMDTPETVDIYNPEYAEKFCNGWTDSLQVSICGDQYLVLLNMTGNDNRNYYAVMDFYGNMVTEATQCDLAVLTEKENILVKNGDSLNEVNLVNLELPEEKSLISMPLVATNKYYRDDLSAGMDIKGNTFVNAIEYNFVDNPFDEEKYSKCDTWYLGGNYSKFTGTWYFPQEQVQSGTADIRLIGDGNVIYENADLNSENVQIDFDIDVSGIKLLSIEYYGVCDITDVLFGVSNAYLHK